MNHFETTWESSDGLELFAQGWEPEGEARAAVCLVHGLGEHSGRYAHVAACLTDHGYALLACDLRGHGKSGGLRGHAESMDVLMADIAMLLDRAAARYPGRPRFLYGHSLGGSLVISFALQRKPKIAGVIATSPGLRPAIPPPGWKLRLGRMMYRLRPTLQMGNGLDREGLSHDPAVVRAYNSDPLVHDRVSARMGLDIISGGEAALAQASHFPLPILIMHGNSDRLTSFLASRSFAEQAPAAKCTFKEWDGCYHELHNEPQQGEVLDTIVGWLDTHMPAQRALSATTTLAVRPHPAGRKKKRR